MIHDYLPVTRQDMETRGWDQCDFVYVTGDAYVDHPSRHSDAPGWAF